MNASSVCPPILPSRLFLSPAKDNFIIFQPFSINVMQIISVEIHQQKVSMKELCSKVSASFAVLGFVGGSIDDGSLWGGDVMHHLFPLLLGIKVKETTTTVHSHQLSKSSLLVFYVWMEFLAYHCLQGPTFVCRHFFLCCKVPGLLFFVQSFSLGPVSTLTYITLFPLMSI